MTSIAFQHLVDEVMRVHAIGIEEFYGRMDPDPWATSFAEVDQLFGHGVSERTLRLAMAVLKAKRTRLVELYREFKICQGEEFKPKGKLEEESFLRQEHVRRSLIKCDACGAIILRSKGMRLVLLERQTDAGVQQNVFSECLSCENGRIA